MSEQPSLLTEEPTAAGGSKRRNASAGRDACANCRFGQLNDVRGRRCRRRAPVETLPGTRKGVWPLVDDTDWCGDHERPA